MKLYHVSAHLINEKNEKNFHHMSITRNLEIKKINNRLTATFIYTRIYFMGLDSRCLIALHGCFG